MHGGSAPQVKEKAAERLREGVMPMLATLYRLANDNTLPPAVQLAAVRDWLDRSGIKEHIVVEVEVKPWERLVDGLLAEFPDELVGRPVGLLAPAEIEGELAVTEPSPPRIPSRRRKGSAFSG